VFDEGFFIELVLVALLIAVNGFFAGAEIAIVAARRGVVERRAAEGDRRARALQRLKADPDRFLATVQIGVTVVGTLASAVGGAAAVEQLEPMLAEASPPWLARVAEPLAVGLVVFAIAYLSLVVGELFPKSLAVRHAEGLALAVARPIELFQRLTGPAVAVLTLSSRVLLRLVGQKGETRSPFVTLDDLKAMVSEAGEQGLVEPEFLHGAIEFHDRDVHEIMTPRTRVVALRAHMDVREALRVAADSGHTRFPVLDGDWDNVAGIVYARDLFPAALAGAESLAPLLQEPLLVPGTKGAAELLQEMRRSRQQMALVVDEHGVVAGVVTIEDLVEVIVGEIHDEHEVPERRFASLGGGVHEAEGSVPLHELESEHGLRLPRGPGYVTLAGLVLDRLGRVPEGGEAIEAGGHRLTVLAVEGRRIARVRIEPLGTPAQASRPS
jgi:putative hemolysin